MADYDSSLPVRTQTAGDVASKISDGTTPTQQMQVTTTKEAMVAVRNPTSTNTMAVNSDGSINANIVTATIGADKHIYGTSSAVAPNTPTTVVTTTVTALKTFLIKAVQFAASGKAKFELKAGVALSETVRAVGFISTANGFCELVFPQPIEIVAGETILISGTNKDNQNQDLYAFINGEEV